MMTDQTLEMDQTMASTKYDIELTAERSGNNTVSVTCTGGDPGPSLKHGSGAHQFKFTLQDGTGLNVKFASLDTEDDCPNCPPPGGKNSKQIVSVHWDNDPPLPRTARFVDNNNNDSKNGELEVCYQWNFTCDDPKVSVLPFDPIIRNGGTP
jgi:hypothetical protein